VLNPGLTVPLNATAVTINAAGQVSATVPGTTTPTVVGQIQLAMFVNRAGLQGLGDNLYLETPSSGTPQIGSPNTNSFGNLQQGNLEQANVEAVSEISDLIAAQRAYEMNAKVITATDQMLQSTSQMLR
jgi:flagellar basal-body rod protein FlgG